MKTNNQRERTMDDTSIQFRNRLAQINGIKLNEAPLKNHNLKMEVVDMDGRVGRDGKLTAKGEDDLRRYQEDKRKSERLKIIHKHSDYEEYYDHPTGGYQSRLKTNWKLANKELKDKGLE